MRKATQPASLNGIAFDAIISRERSYEADVPEYPVEDGFYVSDAVLIKPMSLSVTAFITNTPVTWKKNFQQSTRSVESVIKSIEEIYFSGAVVEFTTPTKIYSSMAITSLTVPETNEMSNAVEIQLSLKEVRVTKSATSTIPSENEMSGETGASGGSATTEESEEAEKGSSILFGLLG